MFQYITKMTKEEFLKGFGFKGRSKVNKANKLRKGVKQFVEDARKKHGDNGFNSTGVK